jgi:hypothetical protein
MLSLLFASFGLVFGLTFVVEPAPVAPLECTELRPCRISDLPSSFTTSDTIIFNAQTTGSSSTYSAFTRTFTRPTLIVRSGVTFSGCVIQSSMAPLINVTGANFISSSSLSCLGSGTIEFRQSNLSNSIFNVQTTTTLSVSDVMVTGLVGSKSLIWVATNQDISNVAFDQCTSTNPLLTMSTFLDTTAYIEGLSVSNSAVTNPSNSMILINAVTGRSYTGTISAFYGSFLTAAAAVLEVRVSSVSGPAIPEVNIDMYNFGFSNSSVNKGLMYFNNRDDQGSLLFGADLDTSTGIDLNNGAILNLYSAGGQVVYNGMTSNNDFCQLIDQEYFAICEGDINDIVVVFTGNVQNTSATGHSGHNCPLAFISAGTAC